MKAKQKVKDINGTMKEKEEDTKGKVQNKKVTRRKTKERKEEKKRN